MEFNEKLIKLRKKEGLSQEELGYKLNVTRQTVSKWELGQTTPGMDKLVEISKIFNISVNELINNVEETSSNVELKIDDQPIEKNNHKGKKILPIIVGILILVIVLIVIKISTAFSEFKPVNNETSDLDSNLEKFFSIFENITNEEIDITQNIINDSEKGNNETNTTVFKGETEKITTQFEINSFNNIFEMYSGTQKGGHVIAFLDCVITNNKTEERKITIKYLESETQNENEIKSIKRKMETFDNYDVTLEYDTDGFINKATIERF